MNWRAGILVAVWFLVGIVLYSVIKKWGGDYWDFGTWQVVAAIGTWLLAGSIVFAIVQVQQARKSTNAQLAMALFRELRSEKTLKILRYIYSLPPREDGKYLSAVHKENIEYVLNRLCTLGILVDEGIIDKSLAIEGFSGPAVLRCWYQLFNYIKHSQYERGDYIENYEGFVRLCLDYFHKNKIKVKFYKEGEKYKELVFKELQKKDIKPRSLKEIKRDRKKKTSKKLCRRFPQKCWRNSGKKLWEKIRKPEGAKRKR